MSWPSPKAAAEEAEEAAMSQALSALSYQKAAMKAPRALSYLWQASMMRLLIEGAVSLCAWGW